MSDNHRFQRQHTNVDPIYLKRKGRLPVYLLIFCLTFILSSLPLLSCKLTGLLLQQTSPTATQSPTTRTTNTSYPDLTVLPRIIPTETPTIEPSATATLTPTNSPTPTITPTPTLKPPTATYTRTPTQTPIPPSLTPGPNQITAGQHVWTLLYAELLQKITVWEVTFSPSKYPAVRADYQFLRINFECTSGEPLTSILSADQLYSAETMLLDQGLGVTLAHNPKGYPNIYITDPSGQQYPVIIFSGCWLASAVPGSDRYILFFRDYNPLPIKLP